MWQFHQSSSDSSACLEWCGCPFPRVKRLSMADALQHPWLCQKGDMATSVSVKDEPIIVTPKNGSKVQKRNLPLFSRTYDFFIFLGASFGGCYTLTETSTFFSTIFGAEVVRGRQGAPVSFREDKSSTKKTAYGYFDDAVSLSENLGTGWIYIKSNEIHPNPLRSSPFSAIGG